MHVTHQDTHQQGCICLHARQYYCHSCSQVHRLKDKLDLDPDMFHRILCTPCMSGLQLDILHGPNCIEKIKIIFNQPELSFVRKREIVTVNYLRLVTLQPCVYGPCSPGHSLRGMHFPSCTTVSSTQLQPGSQFRGQIGNGFQHVPSHPLHLENSWPSISHSA